MQNFIVLQKIFLTYTSFVWWIKVIGWKFCTSFCNKNCLWHFLDKCEHMLALHTLHTIILVNSTIYFSTYINLDVRTLDAMFSCMTWRKEMTIWARRMVYINWPNHIICALCKIIRHYNISKWYFHLPFVDVEWQRWICINLHLIDSCKIDLFFSTCNV